MNGQDRQRNLHGSYLLDDRRRSPREQPRIHTEFVALSGPVFGGYGAYPVGPWANGRRWGVPGYVAAVLARAAFLGVWGPAPGPRLNRFPV